MGNKRYYFNEETLQYEKAEKTLKQKLITGTVICISVVSTFFLFYFIGSLVFISPREKELLSEIEQNNFIMADMSQEIDAMNAVLENIQERDANVHRFMFGMEPIDDAVWEGGTGGHEKYQNFIKYDYSGENIKSIKQKVDRLKQKMAVQSQSLDTLESLAVKRADRLESIPSIKPVRSDKLKRDLNLLSGFGHRIHPIDKIRKMHYGIDFTAPEGTPIHATGKGKVIEAKKSKTGYGNRVIIDHGYGYQTLYAHMKEIDVKVGQEVTKGENIGKVGNTGRSTAAHCHYEVHLNGTPVNPIYFCHDGLTPEEYQDLVKRASITNQSFD